MAETRAGRAGQAVRGTGRAVTGAARGVAGTARSAGQGAAGTARRAGQGAAGAARDVGQGAAGTARDVGQGAAGAATETVKKAGGAIVESLPTGRLVQEAQNLLQAASERLLSSAEGKIEDLTGRLTDYAEIGGKSLISAVTGSENPSGLLGGALRGGLKGGLAGGLKAGVKGLWQKVTGKGGGKGGKLKIVNIVESIDIGAPRRLVYDQWTHFQDFPTFMKKVETVNQESDEELSWKAQVFWSHRMWKSHIIEQVPDQHIIWRSEGAKGYVDGAVTFHALTDDLTRVLMVLEYHPQGLFERTGNLWRAQGRRARLELKHFRRHVMSHLLLHPDEVGEGWRGEIRDSQVVRDHETAMEEERAKLAEEEEKPEEEEWEEEEPERAEEEEPEAEEEEEPEAEEEEEEPEAEEYEEEEPEAEEYEEEEEPEPEPVVARRSAEGRPRPVGQRPVRHREME
ncbi:SRPBCC family protein [Nonomuraea sp. B19D2]|uniref:SRPBCC family protein n=1 Tax=Nonomuraea sp. B19D2 TaxID=3159561 RepID=UPI0032DA4594